MQKSKGYITVDQGVRLYFETFGSGPPVVIPNGFYYSREFEPFAADHTLIFYDVRNRGLSDAVANPAGIQQDVEDLEAIRKHFHLEIVDLMGHSYIAFMLILYAKKYVEAVRRIVFMGAIQPEPEKQYSPPLANHDGVASEVFLKIRELQRPEDPVEACKHFWSMLRRIYVFQAKDESKINWGRCELSNERNFLKYWNDSIYPSIQKIRLNADETASIQCPVLIIHGDQDRSAPYGGALDWAKLLPDARLLALKQVAHAPWVEAPHIFYNSVRTFLSGQWPPTQ